MPELPEVETVCRSLKSSMLRQKIASAQIFNHNLRYQIPKNLPKILAGETINNIRRRSKYILLSLNKGSLIIHLGMSGRIHIKPRQHERLKHEHVNINFVGGLTLCYIDPRRFGAFLWTAGDPLKHRLLKNLGLEPFDSDLTAQYLAEKAKTTKCSVKQFIMNNNIVVGVGNIYATEALFATKINPTRKANTLSKTDFKNIIAAARKLLRLAIKHGGTTIKDHTDSSGKIGSFQNKLRVYGRAGKPCHICKTKLTGIRLGQRQSTFCPRCQK